MGGGLRGARSRRLAVQARRALTDALAKPPRRNEMGDCMFRTTKKDMIFYDLFSVVMTDTCEGAGILDDLFRSLTGVDEKIEQLESLEHKCDRTVHDVIDQLNRSFITPLDREDIFLIAKVIDNIMDSIEAVAHSIRLFNITSIRPEAIEMTALINKSAAVLAGVVSEMKNLKSSKTLHPGVVEVNRLENQGDVVYRSIIKELFTEEKDPIELIKWKEIVEQLEQALDSCEDVANVIEGIVSKNA
jgi:predicted phosphate transport protein (TIGR00153 family)